MSCQLCRNYNCLHQPCEKGHLVYDTWLSIACDSYEYNPDAIGDD